MSSSILIDWEVVVGCSGNMLGQFDIARPCAPASRAKRIVSIWKSTPTYARWKCTCGRQGHVTPETATASTPRTTTTRRRPTADYRFAFGARNQIAGVAVQKAGRWRATVRGQEVGTFGSAQAALEFMQRLADKGDGAMSRSRDGGDADE